MGKALVVIAGPIASGKTSVGKVVAKQLSRCGTPSRFIDIDDLVYAIDPNDSQEPARWRRTTWFRAKKDLVRQAEQLLSSGVEVVVVAAPFFYASGLTDLRARLNQHYGLYLFKLRVPHIVRLLRLALRGNAVDDVELDRQEYKLFRHPATAAGVTVGRAGTISTVAAAIVASYKAGSGEITGFLAQAGIR